MSNYSSMCNYSSYFKGDDKMTNNFRGTEDVISVWQWVGVIVVLGIPIVNIIMYFVWAFLLGGCSVLFS